MVCQHVLEGPKKQNGPSLRVSNNRATRILLCSDLSCSLGRLFRTTVPVLVHLAPMPHSYRKGLLLLTSKTSNLVAPSVALLNARPATLPLWSLPAVWSATATPGGQLRLRRPGKQHHEGSHVSFQRKIGENKKSCFN